MQEAIFECLRPGGALTHFDSRRGIEFEGYLRGVARNVAARVERREARYAARWHGSSLPTANCTAESDLPERLGRRSMGQAVRKAIALLDAEPAVPGHSYGELIRLHFREGLAVRQIAARWCLPPAQVHELRRGACTRLRRLLMRIGIAHADRGW